MNSAIPRPLVQAATQLRLNTSRKDQLFFKTPGDFVLRVIDARPKKPNPEQAPEKNIVIVEGHLGKHSEMLVLLVLLLVTLQLRVSETA